MLSKQINKTILMTTISVFLFGFSTVFACYKEKDVCSNISGTQNTVPTGYVREGTKCKLIPVPAPEPEDVCTNLSGVQERTPDGYENNSGTCIIPKPESEPAPEVEDICTNLSGLQEETPKGYLNNNRICIKPEKEENVSDESYVVDFDKKVRAVGTSEWSSRVIGLDVDQEVELRIKVKNTGDFEIDSLKISDDLPNGLVRVGGSGLTEYINGLDVGETKEFIIKVKLENGSTDNKCYVNEATVEIDGKEIDDDEVVVCYGEEIITELPETGAPYTITMLLFGFTAITLGIRTKIKYNC